MERYNYREIIKADIREWIINNNYEFNEDDPFDTIFDSIYDQLWIDDDVTGNGGCWYDSEGRCEEYICHNLDLLFEALIEFGELEASLINNIKRNNQDGTFARWADCTIRCYLLSECLYEVLRELGYEN